MKLSFTTLGCPDWTLEQVAENARKMGYDGVELRGVAGNHIAPDETGESRAAIRKLFDDNGIEIACIMGYSRFTTDDQDKRNEDIEVAKKFLSVARDVGCPVLRIFGGVFTEAGRDESLRRVIEGIRRLTGPAEDNGVKLAIETHDDWCKGANLRAVLDGVASPALGICWDACNSFFVEPLEETYDAIKDDIVHVHFKDGVRGDDGHVKSALPGDGEVDMKKILQLLHSGGYDGYLSFEWEKKWQPELAEPEVAFPHYIKCAAALMGELGVPRG